jgi:hypothetical protein
MKKGELNRHMKKHSAGKRIKCCFTGCKYSSERKDVLDVHIRRKHMGCHSGIMYTRKMYTNRVRGEVDGETSKGRVSGGLDTTPEIIPRDMLDIFGEREVIRQLEVVIKHLKAENESLTNVLHPFLMKKYGETSKGMVTGVLDSAPGIIPREMLEIFGESEEIQQLGVAIKYLEAKSESLTNVLCPFLLEKYAPTMINAYIGGDLVCDK